MSMTQRYTEFTTSIGSWSEVKAKLGNAWTTMSNTFNRTERRRRLEFLLEQGHIREIPSEWQIMQASRDMLVDYIIPSKASFTNTTTKTNTGCSSPRSRRTVCDDGPTGLAVSREMIVQHLCTLYIAPRATTLVSSTCFPTVSKPSRSS